MKPRTEISVIIPVYNSEAYIERTLNSVAQQTVLPLEVVVIDDGSTDRTGDVVDTYGVAHPDLCLRLIRSPHVGPGAARNRGVEGAAGEWIAFLDSDDLWEREKLEQVARTHESRKDFNFYCHNELYLHSDGTKTLLDYSKGYKPFKPLCSQLYWRNRFSTSAVVCRRDLLIEAGLFDTSLQSAQDYELWLRMCPSIRVCFIQQTLGIYVDRPGNITSMSRWRRYRNVLKVLSRHRNMVSQAMYVKTIARISGSYLYNWIIRTSMIWIRGRGRAFRARH